MTDVPNVEEFDYDQVLQMNAIKYRYLPSPFDIEAHIHSLSQSMPESLRKMYESMASYVDPFIVSTYNTFYQNISYKNCAQIMASNFYADVIFVAIKIAFCALQRWWYTK